MKKSLIVLTVLIFNGCASGPSKQDNINKAIFKITQNISRHDYESASNFFSNDLKNYSEISIITDQNGTKKELDISTVKLGEFISELHTFRKEMDQKCTYDSTKLTEMIKEKRLEAERMGHVKLFNPKAEELSIIKQCFHELNKPKSSFAKDYFHLTSSFSGKDSGTLLGRLSVECGKDRSYKYSTEDIATCYKMNKVFELENKINIENSDFQSKIAEQDQNEREADKIQLAKEDADGTSIQKSYCWTLNVLKSTQEQLDHEIKISKEVGLVNKQKVYDYGNTLVQFKERKILQEKEYKRLTGKILNNTACK